MEQIIEYLKKADRRLCCLIERIGFIPISKYNDPFFFLVSEIVGQMFSARARDVVFSRLLELCGNKIDPDTLLAFNVSDLRKIGLSNSKSTTLILLSLAVKNNEICFEKHFTMADDDVKNDLTKIKGIGTWTAKMYLLFFLSRDDILPFEDGAFMQAFRWLYNYKTVSIQTVIRRCKKWKPYSSYAARYLYIALDSGFTKTPIKEFLEKD